MAVLLTPKILSDMIVSEDRTDCAILEDGKIAALTMFQHFTVILNGIRDEMEEGVVPGFVRANTLRSARISLDGLEIYWDSNVGTITRKEAPIELVRVDAELRYRVTMRSIEIVQRYQYRIQAAYVRYCLGLE